MLLLLALACRPDAPAPPVGPTDSGAGGPTDSAPPSDCPPPTWASGVYTVARDGLERRFRVHVPATYDPDVPAPRAGLHGWGGDETKFLGAWP